MDDNTWDGAFQPVVLDENILLSLVSPWQAARILEREATWLLEACFPGWAQEGDLEERLFWTGVCRELLLGMGEQIYDLWPTVRADGDMYLMSRNSSRGLRLMVGLIDGNRSLQVHLGSLVLRELRRARIMNRAIEPQAFTFLDVMRQEYTHTVHPTRKTPPDEARAGLVGMMTRGWFGNLREALMDINTAQLPEEAPSDEVTS